MAYSSDFQNEISALSRDFEKQQPSDVIQFCANHFFRRLESQRAEHHLSSQHSSGKSNMNDSNSAFPGSNPFGASSSTNETKRGIHRLEEEDESDPHQQMSESPSSMPASAFNTNPFGSSNNNNNSTFSMANDRSQEPPAASSNFGNFQTSPFGASSFGASGSFTGQRMAPMSGSHTLPQNYNYNRRTSVSAESMNPSDVASDNWTPPRHEKTPAQLARLQKAISNNFIFQHLDEEQASMAIGALVEKAIPKADIKVITQGDAGDFFYVIEQGQFDIYVNPAGKVEAGPDGLGNKVATFSAGMSFGELALMYNAPRAATVISTEPSTVWQLDRVTYRRILMDSSLSRRKMYEKFLSEVPLLSSLNEYERSKIADALDTQKYPPGHKIIEEGDIGNEFFLLEQGEAEVYKRGNQNSLHKYKKGDYFGELALLNDAPRAASVVASSDVKVATLSKEGFQRLLGNVESIMRRNDPSRSNPFGDDVDPLST